MKLYHFSSWVKEQVDTSQTYDTTGWELSNYWTQKLKNTDLVDPTSLLDSLQQIVSATGSTLDISPLNDQIKLSKYYSELLKEYIFEDVRQAEFSDKPSRKSCMFLVPIEVNPIEYANKLGFDISRLSAWEVELLDNDSIHFADIRLLDCNSLEHDRKVENARKYWTGTDVRDFNTEVLYSGKFKLKNK